MNVLKQRLLRAAAQDGTPLRCEVTGQQRLRRFSLQFFFLILLFCCRKTTKQNKLKENREIWKCGILRAVRACTMCEASSGESGALRRLFWLSFAPEAALTTHPQAPLYHGPQVILAKERKKGRKGYDKQQ